MNRMGRNVMLLFRVWVGGKMLIKLTSGFFYSNLIFLVFHGYSARLHQAICRELGNPHGVELLRLLASEEGPRSTSLVMIGDIRTLGRHAVNCEVMPTNLQHSHSNVLENEA